MAKNIYSVAVVVAATAFLCVNSVNAAGLVDNPIVGDSTQYLDGKWDLSSGSHHIIGKVPGDLITDLQNANLVGDPLYELNWLNASMWDQNTWTYKSHFTVSEAALAGASSTLLVFDGIKMGATIEVNGQQVGTASDQFRRYVFPLKMATLMAGANTVSVTFNKSVDCNGRWMSCTGGWDWAPYTNTQEQGINTFTKGIWKSVYTTEVSNVAVTHVVPQIFYAGDYPTSKLVDGEHGGFNVDVNVHVWAPVATTATITATGSWSMEETKATAHTSIPAGDSVVTVKMMASAKDIKLWWPAGQGAQPRYNISVSAGGKIETVRPVGFRMFALVTGNDTDPEYVKANKDVDGTDFLGMLWRVNGAIVWSKGANMIPMEELEGRMDADAHTQLVHNAVSGGMNTLRVWGGGMFLPDAWYDACDELGIMVYHDMQYAQGGHSPEKTDEQDAELRHNIRRLSHHPSIVMWDGCNECRVIVGTPTGIYATFVMTVVAEEDKSRAIWPSCPALGWTAGVHRLTSLPSGKVLDTPKQSPGWEIETHGPYQHGTGFPAVNGKPTNTPFDANIPIVVDGNATGPSLRNVFASEFGSSVFSSFESMSPTLKEEHWGVHGGAPADNCSGNFASKCEGSNTMAQRNYPCDSIINVYFGNTDLTAVGEMPFKKQLWQCMVGQALLIKQNIETRRAKNQFGVIVWQFNEIWPTGGWGSIEYGTVGYTHGQVLGGRWKPLHYWYKQSIYADVMATCGQGGECYVKNDATEPFEGTVSIEAVPFATGVARSLYSKKTSMKSGAGVKELFSVAVVDGTKEILISTVTNSAGVVLSKHPVPMAAPKDMVLEKANVAFSVAEAPNDDGSVDVTVKSDKFALWVTFTTLAQGYFSANAFHMLSDETRVIRFIPVQGFDMANLDSLRVEHAATYM